MTKLAYTVISSEDNYINERWNKTYIYTDNTNYENNLTST